MLFATRADAAIVESDAAAAAGERIASAQTVASEVQADGGTLAVDATPGAAATGSVEAPSADATPGAAVAPAQPTAGSPSPASSQAAPAAAGPAAGAASGTAGPTGEPAHANTTVAGSSSPASQASETAPGSSAPAGASEPSASAQSAQSGAEAQTSMREREAEIIAAPWLPLSSPEQPQAAELARDLENLIRQFEAMARDSKTGSAGTAPPDLARASTQEVVPVTVVGSPAPAPDTLGPGGVPAGAPPAVITVISPAQGTATDVWRVASDPLVGVRRAFHRAPAGTAESGPSPTVSSSLPSGAGAALGGGASGLTAPAAALLVVAAACLLATRLLGRRAMDSLAWRSTLFSLRLERPG